MSPDYVTLADGLPWILTSWCLFALALAIRGSRRRK